MSDSKPDSLGDLIVLAARDVLAVVRTMASGVVRMAGAHEMLHAAHYETHIAIAEQLTRMNDLADARLAFDRETWKWEVELRERGLRSQARATHEGTGTPGVQHDGAAAPARAEKG